MNRATRSLLMMASALTERFGPTMEPEKPTQRASCEHCAQFEDLHMHGECSCICHMTVSTDGPVSLNIIAGPQIAMNQEQAQTPRNRAERRRAARKNRRSKRSAS